jgi:CubicO group peptidase (beta-lactamase class C family)
MPDLLPDRPRSLPPHASLRYLKLEAKRRLAGGEFDTLHDAQVAVAREHGRPSWAALKQSVTAGADPESPALDQLRWVVGRFADAGQPGWLPADEAELRRHFDDRLLAEVPPDDLAAALASAAGYLSGPLAVTGLTPESVRAEIGGLEVFATVTAAPPHRLTGLRGLPLGSRVTDPRTANPPSRASGTVPTWATDLAISAFGDLGLAGLILAGTKGDAGPDHVGGDGGAGGGDGGAGGGHRGEGSWVLAWGWADLDAGEVLDAGHRFPASGISALVTAVAALRLVGDGRVALDAPANGYLRTVRLADGTVTVRDLLGHTGGVDSPPSATLTAATVPDPVTVTGPLLGCGGPRGVVRPSNGGTAALGQLVADVTGQPFPVAAQELVLSPLEMTGASYPTSAATLGPRAVTAYDVTPDGRFTPTPAAVCTLPAAGGLWATPTDLLKLAAHWSTLLPPSLARAALPAAGGAPGGALGGASGGGSGGALGGAPGRASGGASPGGGRRAGLGWVLSPRGDLASCGGALPGSTASLVVRVRDGRVHLLLTNRNVAPDRIDERVLRAWARR